MIVTQDDIRFLAECRRSTKLFAKHFFPERFYRPFTKLHDQIFDILDDDTIQKAVIVAPRGLGKTTILSEVYPLKRILFRDSHYLVSLGASETTAIEQTENIKRELRDNERIRAVFGDFSQARMAKEEWVLEFDDGDAVKVMPRGAGQAVRGRRFVKYRPDIVIVDDLENDKHMKSELQRADKKAWFFSSLQNIVDIYSDDWRIIVVGTIMHEDSLLANLLELDDWHKVVMSLADDNLHSNIPEWRDDAWIRRKKDEYEAAGEIDKFYMEYMSTVIPGEHAAFQKEFFQYYIEDELKTKRQLITAIMSDPARTTKENAADTAVMAISVDPYDDCLYVRDIEIGKMSPDQHFEVVLDMADRYDADVLAPEVTGLENYVIYPLKEAMLRRYKNRVPYPIANDGKGIKPIRSKEDRARALIPWYKRHAIKHNHAVCSSLEQSLLSFPRCRRWDAIDCLSNLVDLLDEGNLFVGRNLIREEDPDEIEREFAKLAEESEPPLATTWHRI